MRIVQDCFTGVCIYGRTLGTRGTGNHRELFFVVIVVAMIAVVETRHNGSADGPFVLVARFALLRQFVFVMIQRGRRNVQRRWEGGCGGWCRFVAVVVGGGGRGRHAKHHCSWCSHQKEDAEVLLFT